MLAWVLDQKYQQGFPHVPRVDLAGISLQWNAVHHCSTWWAGPLCFPTFLEKLAFFLSIVNNNGEASLAMGVLEDPNLRDYHPDSQKFPVWSACCFFPWIFENHLSEKFLPEWISPDADAGCPACHACMYQLDGKANLLTILVNTHHLVRKANQLTNLVYTILPRRCCTLAWWSGHLPIWCTVCIERKKSCGWDSEKNISQLGSQAQNRKWIMSKKNLSGHCTPAWWEGLVYTSMAHRLTCLSNWCKQ